MSQNAPDIQTLGALVIQTFGLTGVEAAKARAGH